MTNRSEIIFLRLTPPVWESLQSMSSFAKEFLSHFFYKSIFSSNIIELKKTDFIFRERDFRAKSIFLRMYRFLFRTGSNWLLSHTRGSMSPFKYLLIALTQRLGSLELKQDPREMGSQSDINTFQQLKELVLQGNTWWQRLIENKKCPYPSEC